MIGSFVICTVEDSVINIIDGISSLVFAGTHIIERLMLICQSMNGSDVFDPPKSLQFSISSKDEKSINGWMCQPSATKSSSNEQSIITIPPTSQLDTTHTIMCVSNMLQLNPCLEKDGFHNLEMSLINLCPCIPRKFIIVCSTMNGNIWTLSTSSLIQYHQNRTPITKKRNFIMNCHLC